MCLQLENNKYLDAIREYFGPTCDVNLLGPFCDSLAVTLTENPLLDEVQKLRQFSKDMNILEGIAIKGSEEGFSDWCRCFGSAGHFSRCD